MIVTGQRVRNRDYLCLSYPPSAKEGLGEDQIHTLAASDHTDQLPTPLLLHLDRWL